MNLSDIKKLNIPKSPGVYQFRDNQGKIIYIGKAADLRSRVLSYWREGAGHSPAKFAMLKQIKKIDWIQTDSEIEALLLESNLIKKNRPQFNILMRDDKRYVYIKISTEEEWPRVFLARKIDQAGQYFGPFVSTEAVRETLRALRKIWPYRSCRSLPKRACLYYSIGKCPGVCTARIARGEYLKTIKQIALFLAGKKDQIIKDYELKIKKLEVRSKKLALDVEDKNFQELNLLRYQLNNLNKVLAHTNILGLSEKYAADVVELAKILSLPAVPTRIEGYDISNMFGRAAVGSMVVFAGGEPDKNGYRKFKIKMLDSDGNDVGMLKEVLERRFKHHGVIPVKTGIQKSNSVPALDSRLRGNDKTKKIWALPDLIIVDGGKGQLNAALSVLKKSKLYIPVLAVAKGSPREIPWLEPRYAERISRGRGLRSALAPDKIFFPGQKKPLELSLASPALHLIKRVRDEAHRFAIGYHKNLRRRALFNK